MIGQIDLLTNLSELLDSKELPRFCIIEGPKGSGRKTLIHELFDNKVTFTELLDIKVDTVRNMIAEAYRQRTETFYIILDADKMSLAAQNALLKVTEEPPNKAYFIMTLEDRQNTLKTIISRATIFTMERYSYDELEEYFKGHFDSDNADYLDLCDVPGDVDLIYSNKPDEFYDFVKLVYDNVADVSMANALKTASSIAFKEDAQGYDLKMFWKAFIKVCISNKNAKWSLITSKLLQDLRVNGINKQMLFDKWIITLRRNSDG